MTGVLFLLALCAVLVSAARTLLSDLSFKSSDIVPIAALIGAIIGCIFWQAHKAGQLGSSNSQLRVAALAAAATTPALIGIWYGLYSAKRLDEQRAFHRMGLILMGCAFVAGIFSLYSAVMISMAFVGATYMGSADRTHFLECISWWGLTLLAVPGLLIERECRIVHKKTQEMKREERQKRAKKEPKP